MVIFGSTQRLIQCILVSITSLKKIEFSSRTSIFFEKLPGESKVYLLIGDFLPTTTLRIFHVYGAFKHP